MTFEIIKSDEKILKLHILYLEQVDKLNENERKAYVQYLNFLNNLPILFTPPTEGQQK